MRRPTGSTDYTSHLILQHRPIWIFVHLACPWKKNRKIAEFWKNVNHPLQYVPRPNGIYRLTLCKMWSVKATWKQTTYKVVLLITYNICLPMLHTKICLYQWNGRSLPWLVSVLSQYTQSSIDYYRSYVLLTVYPKKYAHGFCFAVLCCGYTLTDFPISIRLTSLALWQSNDCPSASKATLMNMDKYFMWIHYERLHNHNKAKHNKTVCIFLGIYCN